VRDLFDGAVVVDVDVEPVGLVVHGHHVAFLDDAVLRGEVALGEGLARLAHRSMI
jgi:hypothetical protein